MSSKPKDGLSKAAIKEQQVKLASASTVIQTYAQMILEQPNLELQALPELPAHQTVRGAKPDKIVFQKKYVPNFKNLFKYKNISTQL